MCCKKNVFVLFKLKCVKDFRCINGNDNMLNLWNSINISIW